MKYLTLFFLCQFFSCALSANTLGELLPGEIVIDGHVVDSPKDIFEKASNGSVIYIGPGNYFEGFHIQHDDVVVVGTNAHFVNAAIEGKAAIVVSGNNVTIEGIECSLIKVADKNGACVRQQGNNLTVNNVHFHDAEQGILQAAGTGSLTIKHSRFERLGKDGRAHAIYANGDSLHVSFSRIIGSKSQGHSIKSRSLSTLISDSVISSDDGDDSMLIDISHGGKLTIQNSILHQGNLSVNKSAIGFALEGLGRQRVQAITIINNIILLERIQENQFLNYGIMNIPPALTISSNVFVGNFTDKSTISDPTNITFDDRSSALLKDDHLPNIQYLKTIKSGIME